MKFGKILQNWWQNRITNYEVFLYKPMLRLETIMTHHCPLWDGHPARMLDIRLPSKSLFTELASGETACWSPPHRFTDQLKTPRWGRKSFRSFGRRAVHKKIDMFGKSQMTNRRDEESLKKSQRSLLNPPTLPSGGYRLSPQTQYRTCHKIRTRQQFPPTTTISLFNDYLIGTLPSR